MRKDLQIGALARSKGLVLIRGRSLFRSSNNYRLWSPKHGEYLVTRGTLDQIAAYIGVPDRQRIQREKLKSTTSQILRPHQSKLDARQREQHEREEQAWRKLHGQERVDQHVQQRRMNGGERTPPKPVETPTPLATKSKPKIERVKRCQRHLWKNADDHDST